MRRIAHVRRVAPSKPVSVALARLARPRQLRQLGSAAQRRLVEELRDEIAALRDGPTAPDESVWWSRVREQFVTQVMDGDPRRFLTWRPILKTMFTPNDP